MLLNNPFSNSTPDEVIHFCSREEELRQLIHHSQNNINTILIGINRIGKTTLLHQLLDQLNDFANQKCVFFTIQNINSLIEFEIKFLELIVSSFPNLRPDNFDFILDKKNNSLSTILEILDREQISILIVIDEFQQIARYTDNKWLFTFQNTIQKLNNITFVFSCNNEKVLSFLAGNENQAFFSNADLIQLGPIKNPVYHKFILELFEKNNRSISKDAVEFILAWTRSHTYYTQTVCKRLFNDSNSEIELEAVTEECADILNEFETHFILIRNLISPIQWLLVKAIAKEEKVYHPTAKNFIVNHSIGTPSNVQRALEALLEKELVFQGRDEKGKYYQVCDCFFSRWLEELD